MIDIPTIKTQIVNVGRRMYEKGFVAANDGNISVRVSDSEVLVTPTGVSKGDLTEQSLLKVDMQGNLLEGTGKSTSEIKLHLAAYRLRPDVVAVVHAHPPAATAYSICGGAFDEINLAEAVLVIGKIGLSRYATPTTDEVPKEIEPYIQNCDAVLLQNHGAMTVGCNLMDAYFRMESLEHYLKINLCVHILGGGRYLTDSELKVLEKLRSGKL